jgi:DNA polymerase-3 subunit gamma/tau
VCDSCRETAAGTSVDVIEIDGASNRGIEHIRELREAAKYAPVGGKYKVYVIDEVHMLTNEAFNALLKTLEEPPPHVLFIFATTEPQKIPATIHSRCQRYGFKRIALQGLMNKLREIAKAEGIQVTDQGLSMIARAAEGSMRDGQSLLDQAVSYSGLKIQDEDLQTILGSVAQDTLGSFTGLTLKKDMAALLKQLDGLLEEGQDMRQFLSGVVEHVRNLLVAKIAKDPGQIMELPAADIEAIQKQATGTDGESLLMLFDSLSKTLDDMRWSPNQRFTLEIGLIKACSLKPLKPLAEVVERMKALEDRLISGGSPPRPSLDAVREKPAEYSPKPRPEARIPAEAEAGVGDNEVLAGIVSALKAKKPGLASALAHSRLVELTEREIVIGVMGSSFQMDIVAERGNRSLIEQIAADILHRKVNVKFQRLADTAIPEKTTTPKKTRQDDHDPIVQDALRIFGGQVIDADHRKE